MLFEEILYPNCFGQSTDSVKVSTSITAIVENLSLHQIKIIDDHLDVYDQISLVFLLSDEMPDAAYQRFIVYYQSSLEGSVKPGIVSDWAHEADKLEVDSWKRKLIEGLCIIQQFQLTNYLGVPTSQAKILAAHQPSSKTLISSEKRLLYYICDKLSCDEFDNLHKRVRDDPFWMGKDFPKIECDVAEILMTWWLSHNYIKLNEKEHTIKRLGLNQLKLGCDGSLMDLFRDVNDGGDRTNLKEANQISTNDQADPLLPAQELPTQASLEVASSMSSSVLTRPPTSADDCYLLDKKCLCVIINQRNFSPEKDPLMQRFVESTPMPRSGTDRDRDFLRETFRMFGFQVEVFEDLSHKDMKHLFYTLASNTHRCKLTDYSCLCVCILTHGSEGKVQASNCISLDIWKDIVFLFSGKNCPGLSEKPKVFIIQACQGENFQEVFPSNVETDGISSTTPAINNFLIALSTIPGHISFRNTETGSVFINSICTQLQNYGHMYPGMMEVMRRVNEEVSNFSTDYSSPHNQKTGQGMTPVSKMSLTKNLILKRDMDGVVESFVKKVERYIFYSLLSEYLLYKILRFNLN